MDHPGTTGLTGCGQNRSGAVHIDTAILLPGTHHTHFGSPVDDRITPLYGFTDCRQIAQIASNLACTIGTFKGGRVAL